MELPCLVVYITVLKRSIDFRADWMNRESSLDHAGSHNDDLQVPTAVDPTARLISGGSRYSSVSDEIFSGFELRIQLPQSDQPGWLS